METKTIYVPSANKALNSRLTRYDRKDLSWYNDVYLEKQDGMVVMTKAEFEQVALKIWNNAIERSEIMESDSPEKYHLFPDLDETIKSILK